MDLTTAFHLATAGGGVCLDLPVGIFAVSYRFDAFLVDTSVRKGGIRLFDDVNPLSVLEKILYGANRANIVRV